MNSRKRRSSKPSALPSWVESPFLWVGLLFVFALGFVLFRSGGDDNPPIGDETAIVAVTGVPLPFAGVPDTAIGLPTPEVRSRDFSGAPADISADGTALLIGFFAHWCPHCQAEVPQVRRWLAEEGIPEGVEVLAVSTSVDEVAPNYPPSAWFEREDWPTPVVLDDIDGTIATSFGLTGFPFWVAVDAEGNVAARHSGSLDESQFRALLEQLVDGSTLAD